MYITNTYISYDVLKYNDNAPEAICSLLEEEEEEYG